MLWSTFEKRGFLRSVRSQALKRGGDSSEKLPLEAALLGILEGRYLSVISGRINVSFSDGATSSGYVAPSGKSQSNVMELASELMDIRDEVVAGLPDATNDDDIFNGMMAHPRLRAIKGYVSNHMYMAK